VKDRNGDVGESTECCKRQPVRTRTGIARLPDGLVDVVDVWGSRKKSRINATTVVKVEQKRWHDSDTVGGNLFFGSGPDFTPEVGDNLAEDQGVLGGDRSSVRLE
jgi:hypothetical protein